MQRAKKTLMRCLGAIIFIALSTHATAATQRLVILIWDDYLDERLVAKFERQYDARVVQVNYASDEDASTKLVNSNAVAYDLILTSGIDLDKYVKRGWIAPIDTSKIANLRHIDTALRTAFPNADSHAIPYFWGTVGIAYRRDLLTTPITTWQQLFRPAAELRGKICLLEDGRDLISMAMKSLSYPANSADSKQIKAVAALLLAQKPHVKSYMYMPLNVHSPMLNGEITAAMTFSGDALYLKQHNSNVTYVLPEEGGNIWIDYLTISANSKNSDLAHQFLNFINEPEHAAQQAQFVSYASPNKAAEQHLPAEFLNNPIIYPSGQQLQNSEYYTPLPPQAQRQRNQIMTRVLR